APVIVTLMGNRLYLYSEDKEALRAAQQLVQHFLRGSDDGDFEVIRLKNASAVDAARVLDEAFNGRQQQNQGNRGFDPAVLFGGRGGMMQQAPATRTETVRVVADPNTNSLLVRASPLNMLKIHKLLNDSIDNPENDSLGAMRTWVIGPETLKHATASDV